MSVAAMDSIIARAQQKLVQASLQKYGVRDSSRRESADPGKSSTHPRGRISTPYKGLYHNCPGMFTPAGTPDFPASPAQAQPAEQ